MTTTVHQAGRGIAGKQNCSLCGADVLVSRLKPFQAGDFVGVIEGKFTKSSYRIGAHNQDKRCDGVPALEFHQASEKV